MKRSSLLRHLRRHGCVLKREGALGIPRPGDDETQA